MRVKFQDEEFIPSVSTGKYIVVTQHFDSPVLDNVDVVSPYIIPGASHFHTLQVPSTSLKSPSRIKYPQEFFPDHRVSLFEQTPTKSILRKSSYPVTSTPSRPSRGSYQERNIRPFDWSIRNEIFSKSFDLPDTEVDSISKDAAAKASDHDQLVTLAETKQPRKPSSIHIYENRIADLDYYWTDSDSETLFTAPQSPMSILSTYMDAAESIPETPEEGKSSEASSSRNYDSNKNVLYSPASSFSRSNDNERRSFSIFTSSLDSNDNIKLPSLNTPSPDTEVSCPIFTFADIHTMPTDLSKRIAKLSICDTSEGELIELRELNTAIHKPEGKVKECTLDLSSDESKTNDEDTDLDFSFIDSLTENSSEPLGEKKSKTESPTIYHSDSDTSSKYVTVNLGGDLSDRTSITQTDASISSNMVTCRSDDSLQEIPIAILENPQPLSPDQSFSSCCPL